METLLLKGKSVRDSILAELKEKVAAAPRKPGLAVVLVGDDPASAVYVRNKEKGCQELDFHHETFRLPADTDQQTILDLIARLNDDKRIDGILVQLPLPKGLDEQLILDSVDPNKDVDGFHPINLGRLVAGAPTVVACTPKGIQRLLAAYDIDTSGKTVAIVGRSVIVGRPLAMLLSLKQDNANATVKICHSGTRDLAAETREADIVVAAIGSPQFLGQEHIKPGAVVVDVGINRIDAPETKKGTRLVGDVDAPALIGHVAALTPVPGGVGPMTIAMLLENTYESMLRAEEK